MDGALFIVMELMNENKKKVHLKFTLFTNILFLRFANPQSGLALVLAFVGATGGRRPMHLQARDLRTVVSWPVIKESSNDGR